MITTRPTMIFALLLTLLLPAKANTAPAPRTTPTTVKSDVATTQAKPTQRTSGGMQTTKSTPVPTAPQDMKAVFAETIAAIKKHPNKQNLLVVVHLDSFVGITPVSDAELKKQEEELVKELTGKAAKDQEEIIRKAFQQRVNALILTEPAIADCVKQLQKIGIKVIAITDVIPPVAEFIGSRLKQLGLDFAATGVSDQPIHIAVGTNLHALYKDGILFAGNIQYFEEALTSLVQKTKQANKQILFIARFADTAEDDESN